MIQRDHLRVFTLYLSQIPIPAPTFAQRAAIESLVRKLLDAKGQGPQVAEWERELTALVYEVYGLTEGEIGVVEGRNRRRNENTEHIERASAVSRVSCSADT
jgi:hypothetical protein